ncbi:MAG: ATP-dependent Clp protease ATP-binding subunit, partial [Anaerolineae bacterium]|nr:ATP-dependent Clp protease ATP-binding subunit [Anaerolineae bacterium]
MRAYEILQRYQHSQVDTEHLFLALLEQPDGLVTQIIDKVNASAPVIRGKVEEHLEQSPKTGGSYTGQVAQVFITPRLKRVIDVASEEASKLKDEYISTEHLFLGIAAERNSPSGNVLRDQGVTKERILHAVEEIRGGQRVTEPGAETKYRTLERYSRDLTQMAREDKLDPVIGRDAEILRV